MGSTCCNCQGSESATQHETRQRYPRIKSAKNRSKRDCIDNFDAKGDHFPSSSAAEKIELSEMNQESPVVHQVLDELGEYPEKFVIASHYDYQPSGGPYRYPDGSTYTGQFMEGLIHGYGRVVYRDGSLYEGEFFKGLLNGKGRKVDSIGNFYDGTWFDGEYHGYGTHVYREGNSYTGNWVHGQRSGGGVEENINGSRYGGEFFGDMKNGTFFVV
jgi:hypothetical protein